MSDPELAPAPASPRIPPREVESFEYSPSEHRKLSHPTSDGETLTHVVKGSMGSGILAMPMAFSNAGLWFGVGSTIFVGIVCTYCIHILIKCSHILCRRIKVPSMTYAQVAETSFSAGPPGLQRWSNFAHNTIDGFLVVGCLGVCCVYNLSVAKSVKQVLEQHGVPETDERIYIAALIVPLSILMLIKKLKHLTPFSMIANVCIMSGIAIIMYYFFKDMPSLSEREGIVKFSKWPLFFGTTIFAMENIGVVLSLENNMKTPKHFIGCPSVLNNGMAFVILMYIIVGFLGYLKYGGEARGNVTLNLPTDEILAQSVKLIVAVAIFFTYSLQIYAPLEIISKHLGDNLDGYYLTIVEWTVRYAVVVLTILVAIAVPNLDPMIGLMGAVFLSTLGLIFPAIIETVTYYPNIGWGRYNWILWKNVLLVFCGLVCFCSGIYVNIKNIVEG